MKTVGTLVELLWPKRAFADPRLTGRKIKGSGRIKFEMSNGTVSTVLQRPLNMSHGIGQGELGRFLDRMTKSSGGRHAG